MAGWPGLLIGDISQPRGGPMFTGHASHQVGLDADMWLTPMPNHELSRAEREEMSATMVVAESRLDVDPNIWTPGHMAVIKAAAEEPRVERIFVNAAIKKALCREANGRSGLAPQGATLCPGTTTTFTSASSARPTTPIANRRIRSRQATGLRAISIGGSRSSIIHPKPSPVARSRRAPELTSGAAAGGLPERGDGSSMGSCQLSRLALFLHEPPKEAMSLPATIEELFTCVTTAYRT